MSIQRRHPLSLIEVGIASGLISILLYLLFSAFSNSTFYAAKVKSLKPEVIEKQMLYQRCLQIFSFIGPDITNEKGSLNFTFENHLDPELIYSGTVKANISMQRAEDSEDGQNLVLEIYSNTGKEVRKEVLYKKISGVHFDTATPNLLVMSLKLQKEEIKYAFFLPKTDTQGIGVKGEKS